MKLKEGKITIRCAGNGITIEIYDELANTRFVEVTMTPEDFTAALGRLAYVPCDIDVRGMDRVGKRSEIQPFEVRLPDDLPLGHEERLVVASKAVKDRCPEGWIPDLAFNSQGSFYKTSDGKNYAHTYIRRWVSIEEESETPK